MNSDTPIMPLVTWLRTLAEKAKVDGNLPNYRGEIHHRLIEAADELTAARATIARLEVEKADIMTTLAEAIAVIAAKEAELQAIYDTEPVAWSVVFNGQRAVFGHNAIADFRALDPDATSQALIPKINQPENKP